MEKLALLEHGWRMQHWTMAKGIRCFQWWIYFSILVPQGFAGGNVGVEEVKQVMMEEVGIRMEEDGVKEVDDVKMIEPLVRGPGPTPNCGGVAVQWDQWEGRCGVCGDDWGMQVPRPHETGGEWGRGQLINKYVPGQSINITLQLKEDLGGYFTVKICPLTGADPLESQSCLDGHSLELAGARPSSTYSQAYSPQPGEREVSVLARLPGDLSCRRCVLQWTYYTGNISSTNNNKHYKMFRACADVSIVGAEVLHAGWMSDWWTALFGDDEETTTTSNASSSRSALSSEGNPISPIVTSPGPEERITRFHLDQTPAEDTRGLRPKYEMSELDTLPINVTRNDSTVDIEKQSEDKFHQVEITRQLAPITFTPTSNETNNRSEILNGSLELDQTRGFYLDPKEKLMLGFNKNNDSSKEKSVNNTTFSALHDKPNQTKDDSFKAKTHQNITKPTESLHDINNQMNDTQHKVINNSAINTKWQHKINTTSKPNSTKYIQTVKPPDESKVTSSEVTPYLVPNITGPHSEPNKTRSETESFTAAAIGISIIFVLMCIGIVFILYIKKDREVGALKKAQNSSLYDEAPTRWSEINLSLPSDYEIVPTADPDSNLAVTSSPNPPPTTQPYPSNTSTIVAMDGMTPDYANIPDVVPLSARSRTLGSSPNLLHKSRFADLDLPRTNPTSKRNSRERVRCQSQHMSENHLESLDTFRHDDFSKSQENVARGETYNCSMSQEDILATGADYNCSRSQEDILATGAEGAAGGSSTFPPVAPPKKKKTMYSRISQRWGSEDWDKDESFLAMLAVRLTRMQSRPQITEL